MGSLSGAVIYLGGAIDAAKDDGVGWRKELRNGANDLNLNLKFIDPSDKPFTFRKETSHEKTDIKLLKKSKQWEEITNRVVDFSRHDLRGVDISDCLIAYIDNKIHACGTYFEIERAFIQSKPMFFIVKGGKENCPPWLFSKLNFNNMFDSVEQCLEQLEEMNHSPLPENWILMKDWL